MGARLTANETPVVGCWPRGFQCSEISRVRFQIFFGETCSDLCDALVLVINWIVYGKQKRTKDTSSLSLSTPRSNDHEMEQITHSIQVILLQFQPVDRALRWLVAAVECLYDQSFCTAFDGQV